MWCVLQNRSDRKYPAVLREYQDLDLVLLKEMVNHFNLPKWQEIIERWLIKVDYRIFFFMI